MYLIPQMSTAIIVTQPASDFQGSAKSVSKSLMKEQDTPTFNYSASSSGQVKAAESIIDDIGTLRSGWDGYSAIAISPAVCSNAKRFLFNSPSELSNPEITPTPNGTMNFEWNSDHAEAYLEIGQTRYTGHIQVKGGETIYLDGGLTEGSQDGGIQQALALILGLLHATSTAPSIAQCL